MNKTIGWISVVMSLTFLAGCGQKPAEPRGEAFGSALQAASAEASPAAANASAAAVSAAASSPAPTSTAAVDSAPQASAAASVAPAASAAPVARAPVPAGSAAPAASAAPQAVDSAPAASPATASSPTAAPMSKPAASPAATPVPAAPSHTGNEITWDQFFDSEKQDTPSNRFWDLSGKTVEIKGFMGEVLSFDKHWFLLIPKPGAECPFDNGDETYWNKIMIVFVPDSVKLRYTSGPLKITGRLDVGIKLDESGYKTMFRLYDASFEKIKE
ncbi:LptM family lipoprotein [Paenibacillus ferrarius]|uniref:LptM family lipoprotein n=1 Tax=Paenibacillus ferrarius TaxID=1469647 RepID=UPI003D2936FF